MRTRLLYMVLFFLTGTAQLFASPERIRISPDIYLERLSDNVWIHVSDKVIPPWGNVSANGLIIKEESFAVLVDTPWNNEQSEILDKWISANWKISIKTVIVCHFHDDNLGGLKYFNDKGIKSYALDRTVAICKKTGLPVPKTSFTDFTVLDYSPLKLELYYPGEGHTVDNICVYIPVDNILFGGCLVKSMNSKNLGNTADANIAAWPESLKNLKDRYPEMRTVVPGHGEPGGMELIDHSLSLFK